MPARRKSQPAPLTHRTILYDDVLRANRDTGYQRKSQGREDDPDLLKHAIVQWPEGSRMFYIVRCVEHGLNFNRNNALAGARKHLRTHPECDPPCGDLEAIEHLGWLVEGCNASKADKANAEYDKHVDGYYGHPAYLPNNRTERKRGQNHAGNNDVQLSERRAEVGRSHARFEFPIQSGDEVGAGSRAGENRTAVGVPSSGLLSHECF